MGIDSTSSIQNHDISTQKTIDQSEKTSLVSSASIQFNSIHDRLVEAWQRFLAECSGVLYFLSTAGHVEDYMNVNYLRDTAIQAGARTEYLAIEELGFDERLEQFVDGQNQAIMSPFKLYPRGMDVRRSVWEALGIDQRLNGFGAALIATAIFGLVGIGLMLLGFKLFDWMTPKLDLEKELGENKNVAVAIVIASVIIGISIVIAAAMS